MRKFFLLKYAVLTLVQTNLLLLAIPIPAIAQQFQDSTLNNLKHPPGYKTSKLGSLGSVKKMGNEKQSMILIPGNGFGGSVFDDFMDADKNKYTMYAITPAGFENTPAPPMPDSAIGYSDLTWTNGIVSGILSLIEKEKLNQPIIVAHFITATQVALNLAIKYPEKIGKVVILAGQPYRYYPQRIGTSMDWNWSNETTYNLEQRAQIVEKYWAPRWFKTVIPKTWIENNWQANEYTMDSVKGKKLAVQSALVPLQVNIRYLLEFLTYDITDLYNQIKVPILILIPSFDEQFFKQKPTTSMATIKAPFRKNTHKKITETKSCAI